LKVNRQLCASTSLRIAAGEQDTGRWAFRRLIWEACFDVIQPDISRVGGRSGVQAAEGQMALTRIPSGA